MQHFDPCLVAVDTLLLNESDGSTAVQAKAGGCLYDLLSDPTEHNDLSSDAAHAQQLQQMASQLQELNKNNFAPDRGNPDKAACTQAVKNGGFYGPFVFDPPTLGS